MGKRKSKVGSGYTHCACGGCFEITVSADMSKPELCSDCEAAGCDCESTECAADAQCEDA